jgi:anti-anti-sigma regulatory factor
MRGYGGDLILFNVNAKVLHVLQVLDLADYLTIRESLDEAIIICEGAKQ